LTTPSSWKPCRSWQWRAERHQSETGYVQTT
jgi:hypothetical protein